MKCYVIISITLCFCQTLQTFVSADDGSETNSYNLLVLGSVFVNFVNNVAPAFLQTVTALDSIKLSFGNTSDTAFLTNTWSNIIGQYPAAYQKLSNHALYIVNDLEDMTSMGNDGGPITIFYTENDWNNLINQMQAIGHAAGNTSDAYVGFAKFLTGLTSSSNFEIDTNIVRMPMSSAMALDNINNNVYTLTQQLADTFNEFTKQDANEIISYQTNPAATAFIKILQSTMSQLSGHLLMMVNVGNQASQAFLAQSIMPDPHTFTMPESALVTIVKSCAENEIPHYLDVSQVLDSLKSQITRLFSQF